MRRPNLVPEATLNDRYSLIIKIVTRVDTYRSRFDRAFIVFMHLGSDKSRRLNSSSTCTWVSASFVAVSSKACPKRRRPVVEAHAQAAALLKRTSKHVYEPVFRSILNWGVARTSGFGHRSDPLSRLLDEVLTTSFDWTARRHPDVYDSLLDGRHPVLQFDGPLAPKEKETTGSKPKNRPNRRGRARRTPAKPSPDPSPVIDPTYRPVTAVKLSGTQPLVTWHCEALLVGLASSLASKDPDVVREVLGTCGLQWMLVPLA